MLGEMRYGRSTVRTFVAGMVIGGALAVLYQGRIRRYLDDKTRALRLKAADRLGAAARRLEDAAARLEAGVGRRAEAGGEPVRRHGSA
jgi:hypothetical protein